MHSLTNDSDYVKLARRVTGMYQAPPTSLPKPTYIINHLLQKDFVWIFSLLDVYAAAKYDLPGLVGLPTHAKVYKLMYDYATTKGVILQNYRRVDVEVMGNGVKIGMDDEEDEVFIVLLRVAVLESHSQNDESAADLVPVSVPETWIRMFVGPGDGYAAPCIPLVPRMLLNHPTDDAEAERFCRRQYGQGITRNESMWYNRSPRKISGVLSLSRMSVRSMLDVFVDRPKAFKAAKILDRDFEKRLMAYCGVKDLEEFTLPSAPTVDLEGNFCFVAVPKDKKQMHLVQRLKVHRTNQTLREWRQNDEHAPRKKRRDCGTERPEVAPGCTEPVLHTLEPNEEEDRARISPSVEDFASTGEFPVEQWSRLTLLEELQRTREDNEAHADPRPSEGVQLCR